MKGIIKRHVLKDALCYTVEQDNAFKNVFSGCTAPLVGNVGVRSQRLTKISREFGAKWWFYESMGTGPVGRKGCGGAVRSDRLYNFRLGEGQGRSLRYFGSKVPRTLRG